AVLRRARVDADVLDRPHRAHRFELPFGDRAAAINADRARPRWTQIFGGHAGHRAGAHLADRARLHDGPQLALVTLVEISVAVPGVTFLDARAASEIRPQLETGEPLGMQRGRAELHETVLERHARARRIFGRTCSRQMERLFHDGYRGFYAKRQA